MRSLLMALVLLTTTAAAQAKDPVLDTKCLPPEIKSMLLEIDNRFGPITITSVQRRGELASITRLPTKHAQCKAVDFTMDRGRMASAASWLMTQPFEVIVFTGRNPYIHLAIGEYKRYQVIGPRATYRNFDRPKMASY